MTDGDWPELVGAPRCARCGQPHLPVPPGHRYACGRCGRPLVSRVPRQRNPGSLDRLTLVLRVLFLGVAVVALAPRLIPAPKAEDQATAPRPQAPPAGMKGGGMPMMMGPGMGGGMMAGGPMMGAGSAWGPGRSRYADIPLADLKRRIQQRAADAETLRSSSRNLEVGDLAFLIAERTVRESGRAPRPPDWRQIRDPKELWLAEIRHSLALDRAMASLPATRAWLKRAEEAYHRARSLAVTRADAGLALYGLAQVHCARGAFEQALRDASEVAKLTGEDFRLIRVRWRCLVGLNRLEEAWRLKGPAMGPMMMGR